MSIQLTRQAFRLRADARRRAPLLDAYSHATPQGWTRAATQFEVAFASGGALADVSNLSSVTLEAAPWAARDGARVFARTLPGQALDNALTEEGWAGGARQHALFTFSSAEMNVALDGAARADFWLVVRALTAAGDPLVCGTGRFILAEDGAFPAEPPPPAPPLPGVRLTVDQADARYVQPDGALNFAPGVTGAMGGGAANLDGLPTAGWPDYHALIIREAGHGLTGWVLEPDGDDAAGARSVLPGDHSAGNARTWRERL